MLEVTEVEFWRIFSCLFIFLTSMQRLWCQKHQSELRVKSLRMLLCALLRSYVERLTYDCELRL